MTTALAMEAEALGGLAAVSQASAAMEAGLDPWAAWALANPEAPALESAEGQVWSFFAMDQLATKAARALAEHGVVPGSVVALWGPPSASWWASLWGIWRRGAIALPLHSRWVEAELVALLTRTQPQGLLLPAEALPRAGTWGVPLWLWPEARAEASAPLESASVPDWQGSAGAWVATSGSSGPPKLAHLPYTALVASAQAWRQALALKVGERWWLGLGGYHVGGLGVVLRQALAGGTCVLGAERFQADAARAQWLGCDVVSAVPMQAAEVLAAEGAALPGRLRRLVVGGQAAGPALLGAFGPFAVGSYGLTESASGLCLAQPGDPPGCAGLPLPGVGLKVAAEGEASGPIWVRGPMLMQGYVGDAAANAQAWDLDGWLNTGDVGRMDATGRLWVEGRVSALIVSGGEKLHPGEVEAALLAHPGVAEAVVLPIPDDRFGQRPLAFWRPLAGQGPSSEELRTHLGDRLAGYKRPKAYLRLEAFPRLPGGKVDRGALQAQALAWAAAAVGP